MHITDLIERLQDTFEKHGNLKILSASDDEGNSFEVFGGVSIVYADRNVGYSTDQVYGTREEAVENWGLDPNDIYDKYVVLW